MAAVDSDPFVQAVHDCGLKLQQTEASIAQLADRVWSIEALLFHTPASQFLQIDTAINRIAAQVPSEGVAEADVADDLFATARDLAEPVATSDCTSEMAERVQRLETLLFRTPISNFFHIDEVVSEIVEEARRRERMEINPLAWSPDLSNKFPASLPTDDIFTTAKDVTDEVSGNPRIETLDLGRSGPCRKPCVSNRCDRSEDRHVMAASSTVSTLPAGEVSVDSLPSLTREEQQADHSDIVSIGELSTRMWEDNSVNISGSTGTSAAASALGLPSRLSSSADSGEVAPRCRNGADRSIRIDELRCAGRETHDIFQDPQWTEMSLLLDPTWTEPVPRGLNVVPEEDVLSRAAESGSGSSTGREPSPEEDLARAEGRWSTCGVGHAHSSESLAGSGRDQECGLGLAEERCSSCSTGRSHSPESLAGSSHDQEKRIAHLIAENARLQAQLQALVEQGAEQSTTTSLSDARLTKQDREFSSSASSSKEGRSRMLRSREPRAKNKVPRRQRG